MVTGKSAAPQFTSRIIVMPVMHGMREFEKQENRLYFMEIKQILYYIDRIFDNS